MKKSLIVYAHPYDGSFNHAILLKAQESLSGAGFEVRTEDLNKQNFDPVVKAQGLAAHAGKGSAEADLEPYRQNILWADCLLFIYPIWWGGMPAILKGYVDRVFTGGFAYAKGSGLLSPKTAVIINTTGNSQESYERNGFDKTIPQLMSDNVLAFSGIKTLNYKFFYAPAAATPEQRSQMLEETVKILEAFK